LSPFSSFPPPMNSRAVKRQLTVRGLGSSPDPAPVSTTLDILHRFQGIQSLPGTTNSTHRRVLLLPRPFPFLVFLFLLLLSSHPCFPPLLPIFVQSRHATAVPHLPIGLFPNARHFLPRLGCFSLFSHEGRSPVTPPLCQLTKSWDPGVPCLLPVTPRKVQVVSTEPSRKLLFFSRSIFPPGGRRSFSFTFFSPPP